jgi:hypothetical protein
MERSAPENARVSDVIDADNRIPRAHGTKGTKGQGCHLGAHRSRYERGKLGLAVH